VRVVDLIHAKRRGEALSAPDIRSLVDGYVAGRVPDYQVSALLMAIFFQGMDREELTVLTEAMMRSGEVYDWSDIDGVKADKHSTGGVGDKVSLILAPLAAACGLVVPMVSGRGLGHTGGTLDKLETIPGFHVQLSRARMRRQLQKIGVAMAGQSEKFVPADKKLYALRDVTATVESIPLIATSIMSKKLAEGCGVLVLDIKVGNGAFMARAADARRLGKTMIEIGKSMGRRVSATLTDMNQPLGRAVGHANEVLEAIEALQGRCPPDLERVTYALTARMLTMAGLAASPRDAKRMIQRAIGSGAALEKFGQLIEAQGGDRRVLDEPWRLPTAPREAVIPAPRPGWLGGFDTRQIGLAAAVLGAGRATKEDSIDPGVGLAIEVKIGQRVDKGQPVITVRYRKESAWQSASKMLEQAFEVGQEPPRPPRLVLGTLPASH